MTPTASRRFAGAAFQICTLTLLAVAPVFAQSVSPQGNAHPRARAYKLDSYVERLKSADPSARSSVIVTLPPGASLPSALAPYVRPNGQLSLINGHVLDIPNSAVAALESDPGIFRVHHNRPVGRFNYRTSVSVGALAVQESYGLTGAGVTIAVIDSGIATWHDDMSLGQVETAYPYGDQRVAGFVDLVNGRGQPYDDNGHGTHVTGIIAGNGFDSQGEKAGIAPNASVVSLKVLDADGFGTISNLIAALDWVAANHATYNIRVVNLSIGAPVEESYWTDPLTLAAKAIVDRGIVVVGAAGNFGQDLEDQIQHGAITAPANAPWVLTVGASSTQGTLTRSDDILADYSSNGPTYLDYGAKPDLVAPGTGTVSLVTPGSTFYETKPQYLIDGNPVRGFKPYLSLTGTSMAAPVVSGAVALILEANPSLTPNLVKAILQYTAQTYEGYDPLRQGAGFVNVLGAVQLAQFYNSAAAGDVMPSQDVWSRHIIWGNQLLSGGYLNPLGSAWSQTVVWGETGDDLVWGSGCGVRGCKNIVWGTDDVSGDNVVWSADRRGNIVWGTDRRGNIVWGTGVRKGNIVWGTGDRRNIVWGTDCGGDDCQEVQWGEIDAESGDVWGTGCTRCNIVWGTSRRPNIVWGTGCTRCNIVWGTSENDVTWGSHPDALIFPEDRASEPRPDVNIEFGQSGSEGEL